MGVFILLFVALSVYVILGICDVLKNIDKLKTRIKIIKSDIKKLNNKENE